MKTHVLRLAQQTICDARGVRKPRRAPEPSANEPFRPSKLKRISRPDFVKLDRESYDGGVSDAKLAPGGRVILTLQNSTFLWDLANAEKVFEVSVGGGRVAIGGSRILVSDFNRLTLLDGDEPTVVSRWQVSFGRIWDLTIHPNGKLAVSCGENGAVQFWDIEGRNGLYTMR